ncbi:MULTISPECIES: hypothetical protein [Acinetobacter]|uniref:hypothetical protein n=1 Tax=Acinetobacter TaxID=469 RepID=UPI00143A33C9|nr:MULTISPECIES: hypothetical protein [Acinetobacter]MDD0801256.1 hypothetical protein [Acinetobacter sp. Gutcm_16]NKG38893.1 hypothetical protein [Acinetobacter johnsonii]
MPDEVKNHLMHQFTAVNVPISVNDDGEKKRRTFDAEVYSGGRIDNHYYWGRSGVVIDLQGLQLKSKIGLVEEHFGGKRVGVATSYDVSTKFRAKGHFLSNPKAKEIVQDIDEEYPFQMSWWADPESIEEIGPGKTIEVNGQTFTGPVHIFRNVRVHEITICGVGADTQTTIEAFSGKPQTQPEDTDVTELEKAQARIQELETKNSELETQNKQFAAAKREAEITALGKDLGKEFSAEDITEMKALDDSAFAFSAKQLRQFSAGTQPPADQQQQQQIPSHFQHLFTHQATGGQGGQGQGGNQGSALDQAFSKFAASQEQK